MVSTFIGKRCFVHTGNHLVASETDVTDNLSPLDLWSECALITIENVLDELLFNWVGHFSEEGMIRLKDMVKGFIFNKILLDCISCIKEKMHRQPFPKGKYAKQLLGIVQWHMWANESLKWKFYFLSFIDIYHE